MIVLKKSSRVKSWISDGSRKAKSWFFVPPKNYRLPSELGAKWCKKLPTFSSQGKCRRKKQSGCGTEEVIYTIHTEGVLHVKAFQRPRAPHLAMSPSQAPNSSSNPPTPKLRFSPKNDSSTPQKTPRSHIVPITVKMELKATYRRIYIPIQFKYDLYKSTHLVFQVCGT